VKPNNYDTRQTVAVLLSPHPDPVSSEFGSVYLPADVVFDLALGQVVVGPVHGIFRRMAFKRRVVVDVSVGH
jgi:hypothetical protein